VSTAPVRDGDLAPAPGDVDARCVTALRMLALDMVESAANGHPGLPLGAAPMAWAVWSRFLRHDPTRPGWPDRDRFVLSAGHGSALLYALLHLFGYDVSVDDLRCFRQLGSRTPGHPEHGLTPGVEVTTGPLGQGIAHAVGLALAERMAAARFGTGDGEPIVDHRTFVLCSDGDLMEGVSGEASSLAGHLALGRLVVLWDDNRISIDGSTALAFAEDVCARYRAYGWGVHEVDDGNDVDAVASAVAAALADPARPSFIRVRTTIGYGAPTKAGTAGVHGAPLGPEEAAGLRRRFGWPDAPFSVPDDVRDRLRPLVDQGVARRRRWEHRLGEWADRHPEPAAEWKRRVAGRVDPTGLDGCEPFAPGTSLATRTASGRVLATLRETVPELVGGSADLTESTCARLAGEAVGAGRYHPRQIHFGVREHAMAAICNGIALHGAFRPFGTTFLVFSDYARPALRLAALMRLPVVHVYTHDSIGVGEDGPTHQPVEHLAALRAIPGVAVIRPADANETVDAWRTALGRAEGPTVLALSRQPLPVLPPGDPGWIARTGARVVHRPDGPPDVAIVATGSEVSSALAVAQRLGRRGTAASVVSMPWRERFAGLDPATRATILPPGVPVVVVEAGVRQGWDAIAGTGGAVVCLERFGVSGRGPAVQAALGFGPDEVADVVLAVLRGAVDVGVDAS
jgi:transketolase